MPFRYAMMLGGIPAFCMAASTYIGLGKHVDDDIQGALQHFAAGVLLCTVGTELLPEIVKAEGWNENLAAFVGFFLGVAVLILLGMFAPDGEHREDPRGDDDDGSDKKLVIPMGRKFRQRQTIRIIGTELVKTRTKSLSSLPILSEQDPLLLVSSDSKSPGADHSYVEEEEEEEVTASNSGGKEDTDATQSSATRRQFPLAFVLAVAIDSCLDGLLIGIASAASPSAGPMMSASLSVEMGFLGLTVATTLSGQSFSKATQAALVGPLCLVFAAGLGGALVDTLSRSPVALVGMLSFGTSALLFMVAEELLLDAHEDGEHIWWVDLQLYTGFFASIVAGKFVT